MNNLRDGFTGTKNYFRIVSAQFSMGVDLSKAKILVRKDF